MTDDESMEKLPDHYKVSPSETFILPPPGTSRRQHLINRRSNSNATIESRKVSSGSSGSLSKTDDLPAESSVLVHRYSFNRSESDGSIWRFSEKQQNWTDSIADNNKAIKLLGVDMTAIERAKCLRMMGVTEDDYQKSLEVFDIFNKIDSVKSGTNATKKARQLLGVDDLSLKLDKPFRTLGIDSDNLDRDRMMALSLLGADHTEIINPTFDDGLKSGTICSCSPMQRRPSF